MTKTSIRLEQAKTIQDALHRLVNSTHFSNSSFLKLIHQQIKLLSDEFDTTMQEVYFSKVEKTEHMQKNNTGKELVYISIYCSDGQNLSAWQRVIENLAKQYISRPIYLHEPDVQQAVKGKLQLMNEGYVAIYVDSKAIQTTDDPLLTMKDKWGHSLLSLKDKAIDLKNFEFFWHNSKQYLLSSQGLIFFKDVADFIEES